jgi:hypothetical protein
VSRVYFHSPSEKAAELRGSERAYMGMLCANLGLAIIEPDGFGKEKSLRAWLPKGHYLQTTGDQMFARSWATAFRVGDGGLIEINGESIDHWTLGLNTALVLGNDSMRLLARIHAQCEIHGYVEGPNRAWFAGLIEEGLDTGLYREGQGWEDVQTCLHQRADEPVVMSYSVCQSFPNPDVGDWMPAWPDGLPRDWNALTEYQQQERTARHDAWYELERSEQWDRGLAGLRAEPTRGLEFKPDNWDSFRFGHTMSAFDLEWIE